MEQKLSPEEALRVDRQWETGERFGVLYERIHTGYYTFGTEIAIDMHWLVKGWRVREGWVEEQQFYRLKCEEINKMLLWKLHSLGWEGTIESLQKEVNETAGG